jgi:ubiquinone/menaquinone biosynthesis C-methylase UbiE
MSFDYEQSIWGKGTASLRPSDPTSIRLRQALFALEQVPDGATILEVGSGAGQFIRAIKQVRQEINCLGCDISRGAIEQAKTARDGVTYALSEENRLPYGDGVIDMVLLFDVLEHVQNPEQFLMEIKRVLKPGGLFFAFVPCEGDWLSFWHCLRMFGIGKDLTKKYAGHINYFSRKSLKKLIKNSGFNLVRVRYSEHKLGQWLGIIAFFMMDRAAKRQGVVQMNNEAFFQNQSKVVILPMLKKLVNTLVYIESVIFAWLPSPNVHITVKK